jgi:tripartite-type tricarboxylate transporter receptor subunit TctC
MADVVGGQIPLVCTAIATAQQFLRAGKLKGIGISGEKRDPAVPDVPTFVESGMPGFVVNSWVGILAPAHTPRAVIDRLQTDIAAVLQLPDVRARYAVLGIEPVGNKPEEYAAQLKTDLENWGPVVKKANVRIE